MARLCDPTVRPSSHAVVEVRVEAPEDVDDTLVTFADGHKTYVHSKENIRETDGAWEKVWKDFENQSVVTCAGYPLWRVQAISVNEKLGRWITEDVCSERYLP